MSAERSRTTPSSSHVLFIARPATHDSEADFGPFPGKRKTVTFVAGDHFVLVFCFKKNARVAVGVFLRLFAFSVFVSAQLQEEPSGVPASGCVWSGSRLSVLQDPNSALRDSYSKPTHCSIKRTSAVLTNADTRSCYSSTHFMAVFTRAWGGGDTNMLDLVLKTADIDTAKV